MLGTGTPGLGASVSGYAWWSAGWRMVWWLSG